MQSSIFTRKMYLAGKWVTRDQVIEVRDPQDEKLIDKVPVASEADMLFAIEEGKKGAKVAAEMPVHQRISILRKAADWIAERHEFAATLIAQESSKTIREARKEVTRCIETLHISSEEARRIEGETISFDQMEGSENRLGYYYRFPVGLIGAITPFNDPLNLVAHKIGPAIASGNAIIVKPAGATPLSAMLLAQAFDESDLPAKVLSVITGHGSEIGNTLVTHPDVRMLSFTGGLQTGETIMQKAGIKKIGMELGSNSPVIVLADADLNEAVDATVSGAFWAAGQNCLGVQRVFVEQGIFSSFSQRFVEQTRKLQVGNKLDEQTDMGPLISQREAERVEKWVEEAVEQGATLLCGGQRRGAYYLPTVLTDIPDTCQLATEEVFGPVVLLYSIDDFLEALNRANEVNFGLQAGIFTNNIQNAFQAVKKLHVGGVMINDSTDYRIDAMPFGGVKGSGLGREGVKFAIQEMTETKVVCIKLPD